MNWWMEKPYRMVQNNLRDIDGAMDVDYEVDMLKKLGANVVQVGCGGISAYGPVSYTHLDVYKRQALHDVQRAAGIYRHGIFRGSPCTGL